MHCVIVANAPQLDLGPYSEIVRAADLVIAADGGARPLLLAGLRPQIVIGDLDSLDAESAAKEISQTAFHFWNKNMPARQPGFLTEEDSR